MVKKILKLGASWCQPCKVFSSTFNRVKEMEEYKDIEFKEFEIDEDEDGEMLAEKYQVRSVPTTVLLNGDDEVVYKIMGNVPQNDFITIINEANKRK